MGAAETAGRPSSRRSSITSAATTVIVAAVIAAGIATVSASAQFSQGNLRLVCVSAEENEGAAAFPSARSCSPGAGTPAKVQAQAQASRDTARRQEQAIVDLQSTVRELLEKLRKCEERGGGGAGRMEGVDTLDRKVKDLVRRMENVGTPDTSSRSSPYAEDDDDDDDGGDGGGGGGRDDGDGGGGGDEDAVTDAALGGNSLGKFSDESDSVRLVFSARTNYMYARVRSTLPELHAFTLCTWLRRTGLGMGTILSYAVTGQPNELTLMEAGGDGVEVVVNDKVMLLPLRVPRLSWHHVCVSWSARDGAWSSFLDGVRTGSGDGLAPWRPLTGGGVIVLGQEQDVLGGHFDATQAFVGELTQLGVWAVSLPPQAVSSLAFCVPAETPVRVLAWSRRALEVRGGRGILREGPPCPLEQ